MEIFTCDFSNKRILEVLVQKSVRVVLLTSNVNSLIFSASPGPFIATKMDFYPRQIFIKMLYFRPTVFIACLINLAHNLKLAKHKIKTYIYVQFKHRYALIIGKIKTKY